MRTALGVGWVSFFLVALIGAANDIIATRFGVAVESVSWAVRIGLFVVPPAAFAVAKRFALGLQRRDRDRVLHGRETGIIKRLPNGEFIEVHEPLSREKLHALTQYEQYKPITPGPSGDASGPDTGSGLARRLRARLSRGFYGENTQIAKPTEVEYKEITSKH
jgi:ubiquinol-cytochrome c reductase cytochrome b subunit